MNKIILISPLLVALVLVGVGCERPQSSSPASNNNVKIPPEELVPAKTYSLQQVAEHSGPDDCWVIVDQSIFNVTEFANQHQAGAEVITQWCGQDATEGFNTKNNTGGSHSATSKLGLDPFFVGNLIE